MNAVPMIAVKDVRASAQYYVNLLAAVSGHGGDEYEQLLVDGKLVLQLHDCREDASHGPLRDLSLMAGNGVLLWFTVDDLEPLLERVRARRIPLLREPARNPYSGSMELWLEDQDGYRIVIAGPSDWKDRQEG